MRYARWEPTRGPQRGTVCVFTGRAEMIEKYFEVVADLRRRGYHAVVMDWRGQGGSWRPLRNPHKGWIRDFSEYERDLACFMREVVLPRDNESDLADLPEGVREEMTFTLAERIEDVLAATLPEVGRRLQAAAR